MEIPPRGIEYMDNGLLERIEEISGLCERVEHDADVLLEYHGSRSEAVASVKALQVSVAALRRELLQLYLEHRIADAAQREG